MQHQLIGLKIEWNVEGVVFTSVQLCWCDEGGMGNYDTTLILCTLRDGEKLSIHCSSTQSTSLAHGECHIF